MLTGGACYKRVDAGFPARRFFFAIAADSGILYQSV